MMSYETIVRIMNRLVENGVSLNKAYYGVFGDYPEKAIIVRLYKESATSKKLEKLLFREYSKLTKGEVA